MMRHMTTTQMSAEQAARATDEIMAAAKLYDRYVELSGIADVNSFQAAVAADALAVPRPAPLTLTFARR
jgi:hypothetical protein